MLSAILIDADREPEASMWASDILTEMKDRQPQLSQLHFKSLTKDNGRRACEMLAAHPMRAFVVSSNKKNMRGYENPYAGLIPSKNWFYCWLTRLLLERVTHFAHKKSIAMYGEVRPLQIVFSERGRFSYGQLMAYYDWLKMRNKAGKNSLPLGDLAWDVMRRDLFDVQPDQARPALQLSDIVASAFFRASDIQQTSKFDPECAKRLLPRMARDPDNTLGMVHGFGVKLMPKLGEAKLTSAQQAIYRFYGYPRPQWWMPKRE